MTTRAANLIHQVAISNRDGFGYPKNGDYSPSEHYPEYPYGPAQLSRSNQVYGLVRQCLREFGCDSSSYGEKSWNPLGDWIRAGDRVFLLTNFVMHRRPWESRDRFDAKCTHASVIRAVLDYAIIAAGDADLVSYGNAPLQSCDYESVASETGATAVSDFYRRITGANVGPCDLRLLRSRWTNFGAQLDVEELSPENAVSVDLGQESWLNELFAGEGRPEVRVGDYPPAETMACHERDKHVYLLNRKILESDVIISVPKLKTHQKVGITCALKGTVGSIARKECLAHHRRGPFDQDGDEYPRAGFLRDLSSTMSERACNLGTDFRSNAFRVTAKLLNRALRFGRSGITYGSWHGNDTAWRMTLDIARIIRFGRLDGSLSDRPMRRHLALVDGIVAGEGEGPLRPKPRHAGVILFGPDICAVDAACAYIMGFNPTKLRLLNNSFQSVSAPITEARLEHLAFQLNGTPIDHRELVAAFRPGFETPKGWVGAMEYTDDADSPSATT